MKQPLSPSLSRLPVVQPLERAYDYLLQLLITRFRLVRQDRPVGTRLEVSFDRSTPSIWNGQGKEALRMRIPNFRRRARELQTQLDEFLIKHVGRSSYEYDDGSFPFRYVSGGTLPVVQIGRQRYYCLFYREIEPIGWNIANGSADSFHELLDPRDTVRREFGEELLIINPKKRTRCVFQWAANELAEWPGFSVARGLFQRHYPGLNIGECRELHCNPKWEDGPDSLLVSCEGEETRLITGCFLNINATDFGIEIDRVANIKLEKEVVIFDGEINGNVPVGAPIGLFPVDELDSAILDEKQTSFKPTSFFFDAERHDNGANLLPRIIEDVYIPRLLGHKVLLQEQVKCWKAADKAEMAFDLCPVTRSLILRYIKKRRTAPTVSRVPARHYDFFLSWAAPDESLACQTYEYLTSVKKLSVFFSAVTPMQARFGEDIRAAVHGSAGLIVIATQPRHLRRVGVMNEWVTFLNDIDDGRKRRTAPLVNFTGGFGYDKLPNQLSMFHLINFDPANMKEGLGRLGSYIDRLKQRLSPSRT